MAKLYFNFSAMNAGKSTLLLQASYNYQERGMRSLLFTAALDNRTKVGEISSRIGLKSDALIYDTKLDLFACIEEQLKEQQINAVFIDEAQFLTEEQVWQLARVADHLRIPVMAYGLRTDFQGKMFPGSAALLAIADILREVRTICWCGSKATMVARMDESGNIVEEGDQVVIGGEESYISLCRKHWSMRKLGEPTENKDALADILCEPVDH
ncbi:thymidine kinase [Pseudovibrio brasiliensis]|uniref:Thymidine kinase n=1 Tax=Pseudovibrio brasiliensis TaxID=1898042 RepID=A0ABX8AM51_9HYPH|nr:thymidine kinase [Pseudovibrio brasiliensis]QUS54985.1 thymidine kinase [Pseudovibrio brasiliensis]